MQREQKNKLVIKHLFYLGAGLLVVLFFAFSGIGCPLRRLLGVPCPTCGTTRALFSLVRLDFVSYFLYQPLALFLLPAIWVCIHRSLSRFPILRSRAVTFCLVLFFVVWVALYFFRLSLCLIP